MLLERCFSEDIERDRDFVTPTPYGTNEKCEESIKEYLLQDWAKMTARYRERNDTLNFLPKT